MPRPDYHGGSIVNLMSSVIAGRGGTPDLHVEADLLSGAEIAAARHVVLVVVDGLGHQALRARAPHGWMQAHLRGPLTSVFPSTTASGVTTFLTGDAPQQHGLTGWHMYLRELGAVMTVLPGRPRYGGVSYGPAGVDVEKLLAHRSVFGRIAVSSTMVSPQTIARSDFNRAHLGPARLRPYDGRDEMLAGIYDAVRRATAPSYVHAYWPRLDELGHRHGIHSPPAVAELLAVDAALEKLAASLRGTGTLLVVAADHGQIDTRASDRLALADHPALAETLLLPLCGEPRVVYCYPHPDRAADFVAYVEDELAPCAELHRGAELIREGWFGLGPPHSHLHDRVGPYVLLMKESYVLNDRLFGESGPVSVGVHGGISEAEMMVPLVVADC